MAEKRLISFNWIVGYLAMWAVRAVPDGWPRGLYTLIQNYSIRWDRTASEWMTREQLEKHCEPLLDNEFTTRWSRPAVPELGDPGFDTKMLVALIVESTWANGAPDVKGRHTMLRPVVKGERVKSMDPSPIAQRLGWCIVSIIHDGEVHIVTEEGLLGAGWVTMADLRDPSKYERGGFASEETQRAMDQRRRQEVAKITGKPVSTPDSVPPLEHGVPLADLDREGIASPRRMTEREVAEAEAQRRATETEAQRIDRETREENDRRDRQHEKRSKRIHDAAWWGALTTSLSGTALTTAVGEGMEQLYGSAAMVERAAKIADVVVRVVRDRSIVPPTVFDDIEPLTEALQQTEAQPLVFNMTNSFGGGEPYEAIWARIMGDIARVFSGYVVPAKPTDVFNPNTGKFETKGATGKADVDEQERRARAKGYASKLENELCALLAPHVGEVLEEQLNGAGAVQVLERILKGHRERIAAQRPGAGDIPDPRG